MWRCQRRCQLPCVFQQHITVRTTEQTEVQLQQQRGQVSAGGQLIQICIWVAWGKGGCTMAQLIHSVILLWQVDNWSVTRETARFYGDRQQRQIFVVRQGCHKRKHSPPLPQDQRVPVCLAIIAVYLRCSILGKQRQMKPPGAVVGLLPI